MELKGKIQEKTNNSIKVNNFWIKFFDSELLQGINAGDEVEVNYKDNKKDGKTYHNGTSIKLTKLTSKVTKIDTTTLNTIIMCSKDIVIKSIETGTDLEFNTVFKAIYKTITEI